MLDRILLLLLNIFSFIGSLPWVSIIIFIVLILIWLFILMSLSLRKHEFKVESIWWLKYIKKNKTIARWINKFCGKSIGKFTKEVILSNGWLYFLGIISLSLATYYYSEVFIDFSEINDSETTIEKIKLTISILGPVLTFLVFLRTIKAQESTLKSQEHTMEIQALTIKGQAKDRVSKDFYELLKIFCSKRGANNDILLNEERKFKLEVYKNHNRIGEQIIKSNLVNDPTPMSYKLFYYSKNLFCNSLEGYTSDKEYYKDKVSDIRRLTTKRYFSAMYSYYGDYFKTFHRILKILNHAKKEKIILDEEYKNYIGILRSQLTDLELALIYNNAVYSKFGSGMALELIESGLFGNIEEINNDFHIIKGDLIDPKLDSKIMGCLFYKIDKETGFDLDKATNDILKNNTENNFYEYLEKERILESELMS